MLYLNAGIMPAGVDWRKALRPSLTHFASMLNGENVMLQHDHVTSEHLQAVFATNVLGHYLLVRHCVCLHGIVCACPMR